MALKEQELAEGQQEIAELERTWRNYERQVQKQGVSQGRDIELDEDQVSVCQKWQLFPFLVKPKVNKHEAKQSN